MDARPTHRALAHSLAVFALSCAFGQAQATESGPSTPFGVYDFGAGMTPPPSDNGTVGFRSAFYTSTVNRDGAGNQVLSNFKLNVLSLGAAYIRMTNQQFLGGNVGFGGVLPFLDIKGHFDVPTPVGPVHLASSAFEQGDLQVFPLIVQWNSPHWFANATLQVQAPTGSYDSKRLFNPGSNHWTVGPLVGVTYLSPSGFEVSSNFELDFNSVNHSTDYRSGVEYKHEFALGQHIGPYTVGLGGYWYKQLTDDSGPGSSGGNRAQALALGPALSFFQPGLPMLWLHAYKEFDVRNRSQGYTVALRVAKSF